MESTGVLDVDRPSLTERARLTIREAILDWRYAPGQALSESVLASELSMSRTPIREALRSLKDEGLVQVVPARGVFVAEIVLRDVVESFQVREALESFAAGLACENEQARPSFQAFRREAERAHDLIDAGAFDEYHRLNARMDELIVEAAANQRLATLLRGLWDRGRRLRKLAYLRMSRLHQSVDEHLAIVDAIVAGDRPRAEERARRHVQNSFQHALWQLSQPASGTGAMTGPGRMAGPDGMTGAAPAPGADEGMS